jgi:hypothetical protein
MSEYSLKVLQLSRRPPRPPRQLSCGWRERYRLAMLPMWRCRHGHLAKQLPQLRSHSLHKHLSSRIRLEALCCFETTLRTLPIAQLSESLATSSHLATTFSILYSIVPRTSGNWMSFWRSTGWDIVNFLAASTLRFFFLSWIDWLGFCL